MKRGRVVTVFAQGWQTLYGSVTTSSGSAIRETLHEALDVWLDDVLPTLGEDLGPSGSPFDRVTFEVRR